MRKFGLIGYPLGHSFSKAYFTEKFRREGIYDAVYENYPLENIALVGDIIRNDPDLRGLNVTIPYKSDIIPLLDNIDAEASEIGAVNVVSIRTSGTGRLIYGHNSDVTGIRDSIGHLLRRPGMAMVLGTGGASKAVIHVLKKAGFEIIKVSRRSGEDAISYDDIRADLFEAVDIIINTTPMGMYPSVESKPALPYDLLEERHTLFDLVYNPEVTAFMQEGLARGCKVIGGLRMLHSQAEKSWSIWNEY